MNDLKKWIAIFAAPAAAILGGLILLFSPDTATVLIATVIGWLFLLAGVILAVVAITGNQGLSAGLRAAVCIAVGVWLTRSPMSLAVAFGKLLGLGLLIGALSGYGKSISTQGRAMYLLEGVFGVVLLIAPLAASRTVYTILGLVLVAVGIIVLVSRFKNQNRLDSGSGRIIDV